MARKKIVIVGAGAKAAAIVARAVVLRQHFPEETPEITVIERTSIGAAWSGDAGFSDGGGALCTPPEMDIGFPYSRFPLARGPYGDQAIDPAVRAVFDSGPNIRLGLLRGFSWQRFLLDQAAATDNAFADYVLRGRPYPSHGVWARYLRWVFREAGAAANVITGEVTHAARQILSTGEEAGWRIEYRTASGQQHMTADAVVLTGTGEPIRMPTACPPGEMIPRPHLLDGANFWDHVQDFRDIAHEGHPTIKDLVIAVIGSGGGAATILDWLHGTFLHRTDVILISISSLGAFLPRGDGYGERQWLADPARWTEDLTPKKRREILKRTDQGVISARLKAAIDQSDRIVFEPERVARLDWVPPGALPGSEQFQIRFEREDKKPPNHTGPWLKDRRRPATHIIQATGFDPWSVLDVIDDPSGSALGQNRSEREHIEETMGWGLTLPGFPSLHVPGLAGILGMGFPSLGALGLTAARILDPYVARAIAERPECPENKPPGP